MLAKLLHARRSEACGRSASDASADPSSPSLQYLLLPPGCWMRRAPSCGIPAWAPAELLCSVVCRPDPGRSGHLSRKPQLHSAAKMPPWQKLRYQCEAALGSELSKARTVLLRKRQKMRYGETWNWSFCMCCFSMLVCCWLFYILLQTEGV